MNKEKEFDESKDAYEQWKEFAREYVFSPSKNKLAEARYYFITCLNSMEKEIMEEVRDKFMPCLSSKFLEEYCKLHWLKHLEKFIVKKEKI